MTLERTIQRGTREQVLLNLVLGSVTNPKTSRSYKDSLNEFFAWRKEKGDEIPVTRALVSEYVKHLAASGLATSSVNVKLSAIRKMAREAADNGYLDPLLAETIATVKGLTSHGRRSGNWLTKEQAQALLETPGSGWKGARDRAILGVFLGCGLRLSEVSSLKFSHFQQREGRWVILDLIGKKNRVRTVPMPAGVKAGVDAWAQLAGLETGYVFRALTTRGDHLLHDEDRPVSVEALNAMIEKGGSSIGVQLSPHDLRRTFAKLARKGGASLEQIQLSLGHASITTTDIYLGSNLDLEHAPCDQLGLRFAGRG